MTRSVSFSLSFDEIYKQSIIVDRNVESHDQTHAHIQRTIQRSAEHQTSQRETMKEKALLSLFCSLPLTRLISDRYTRVTIKDKTS